MTSLSWKIKQARLEKGLTQEQLASKLGYVSGQFISNIERGVVPLPASKFKALVRWTGLDKRELVEAYADDARQFARKMVGI